MATVDPCRSTTAPADGIHETPSPALPRGEVVRTLLWVLVVTGAVSNMAASYAGADTWVHLTCGVVTLLGAGTLVVRNLRGRR